MRIVGGTLRGRPLKSPHHSGLRPTSDRVREALFNILVHGTDDFDIAGAKVMDLFAGTGALGLEALSRGAAFCLFVETNADARALIQHHVTEFGLGGTTRIFRRDAADLGAAGTRDRYDLVFLDPPYGKGLGERALAAAEHGGWLHDGAIIVLEEAHDADIALPQTFEILDRRSYATTQIIIARYLPAPVRPKSD
jgi:16S rRNA (guanine966-N2)-methyltransferase